MDYAKYLLSFNQMHDEYQKLHRSKFIYPYFYKITNGKQFLYFVGAKHSYDPKDTQHIQIEQHWNEFINVTKKVNCISLTEGGKRLATKSKSDSLARNTIPG